MVTLIRVLMAANGVKYKNLPKPSELAPWLGEKMTPRKQHERSKNIRRLMLLNVHNDVARELGKI